jgi:hypothetical protein
MARPRKLTPEQEQIYWQGAEEFVHRRTMRNNFFMMRALRILFEDGTEYYDYLFGEKDGKKRAKKTLLAELGRIGDEEIVLRDAETICRLKLTTCEGLAYLRLTRGVHGHYDGEYEDLET